MDVAYCGVIQADGLTDWLRLFVYYVKRRGGMYIGLRIRCVLMNRVLCRASGRDGLEYTVGLGLGLAVRRG